MFNNSLFPQDIIKRYDSKSYLSVGKFSPGRPHICNWDCAGIFKEKREYCHTRSKIRQHFGEEFYQVIKKEIKSKNIGFISQKLERIKSLKSTVRRYKFNHLSINSTTAVAAEARVKPAFPATAVVECMAKWSNLCPRTVTT